MCLCSPLRERRGLFLSREQLQPPAFDCSVFSSIVLRPLQHREDIRTFPGVHGTSRQAGESIMRDGFSVSTGGRLGTGAYSWRHDVYGKDLAICWFRYWRKKGHYPGGLSVRGVVITAELRCCEDEYLDLDMDDLRDETGRELLRWPDRKLDDAGITRFHDYYISVLEKRSGARFVIIGGKVTLPEGHRYPKRVLGLPRCYCARTKSCIIGPRLEEIDG